MTLPLSLMTLSGFRGFTHRSAIGITLCLALAGCKGLLDVPLPPGEIDPGALGSVAGADALRNEALIWLTRDYAGANRNVGSLILSSGTVADEFTTGGHGTAFGDPNGAPLYGDVTDRRIMSTSATGYDDHLSDITLIRQYALQGIAATRAHHNPGYGPLVGEMFLVTGFTELFVAENFCSGVALSDIVPGGDLRFGMPMTSAQWFARAAADFDSALVQAADPSIAPDTNDAARRATAARVIQAAHIGKGRALLGAGDYVGAAAATANVPDDFVYAVQYDNGNNPNIYQVMSGFAPAFTMSDREGNNGLPFRSAADPRLPVLNTGQTLQNDLVDTVYFPGHYATDGATPVPLVSGIEARLIEAEAALGTNDVTTWLDRINHLRATVATPAMSDTTDPGTPAARLDLTFYERGFWLFGTAHRLGDLRRLVTLYHRPQASVFPNGTYVAGAYPSLGFGPNYGGDMGFGIPLRELQNNPHAVACMEGT